MIIAYDLVAMARKLGAGLVIDDESLGYQELLDAAEVDEGIRAMRKDLVMGEGTDVRTLFAREIMDSRPPIVWAGNPGVPTPEALFSLGPELGPGAYRRFDHLRLVGRSRRLWHQISRCQ
jgi:hypothetical protein